MRRVKQSVRNMVCVLSVIFNIVPEIFFISIFLTLFNAALPYVNVVFLQIIIDEFIERANYKRLIACAVSAILLNVIILLFISILKAVSAKRKVKFELQFRRMLGLHQMEFTLADIESNKVSELQRNIVQTKMRNGGMEMIIDKIEFIIKNVFSLLLAVFSFIHIFSLHETVKQKSFWTGPYPLIGLLVVIVFLSVVSFKAQAKQNEKVSDLNQKANQANGGAFMYMELISDYHFGKDIRIYSLKDFLCKEFNKLWNSSIGHGLMKKLGREKAMIPCITSICNGIMDLLIYLLAVMKAVAGEITAGEVVLYVESIHFFTQAVMELINSVSEMMIYGELLSPYLDMLGLPEETHMEAVDNLPAAPYTISFHNVSFRYPGSDKWVLREVSFVIGSGQRIALVGANGSGKSTAIKLLCRFYEPQMGEIRLNGINIKRFDLNQYRRLISTVFQDFSFPSLSVGETIACLANYSKEEMFQAVEQAGLSGWMEKQTAGADTYLYKEYEGDGIEISGGEAQKIAIARTIYKHAPIVILDEPTAALDPSAEAEIYENFNQNVFGRTVVYISHRLSSCRFCNSIFVFDKGYLVQRGTHEQLVSEKGKYQSLWNAQAEFYKA